ncbi:hypothetical protein [Thermococcus sp.]|uniref:hypothetical protein n=1 Tax=Thermococcus sp. TaxID=35749 RepID=UPI002611671A|nr:hypothetical protein [Thermococcus sp.]
MRELWVRWGRGYLRLMLLGAVYGVVEEGLIIKSWFDPHWKDLGMLGTYGRVWGVNTVWAAWLTIFHSLLSVSLPVLVVEALYPSYKNKPLLEGRGLAVAAGSFTLSGLVMFIFLNPYRPPLVQYTLTIVLVGFLLAVARYLRKPSPKTSKGQTQHPFLYGLAVAFLLFFVYTAFPHSSLPPVVTILLGVLMALYFYSQLGLLDDSSRFLLVLGFLSFWMIPYDILLELKGVTGEAAVGITAFLLLLLRWRSVVQKSPLEGAPVNRES